MARFPWSVHISSFDRPEKGLRVGEPVLRIFCQGLVDDVGDSFVHAGVTLSDGDGGFIEDDVDGVAALFEGIGELAGEEVVDAGGHGPDIAGGFDVFVVGDLFAGHEDRGAGVLTGHAHAAEAGLLEIFGEPEVPDFGDIAVEEDIGGFEVAVDEALFMGGGEAFEGLEDPGAKRGPVEHATHGGGHVREGAAVAVFHDKVEGSFL